MSTHEGRDLIVLAHRVPFPPDKGDKIRSYHMIRHLADQGWKVHLLTLADDPDDLAHVPRLEAQFVSAFVRPLGGPGRKARAVLGAARGNPLSAGLFYDRLLQDRFDETVERVSPAAILCICSPMAEYVFRSKAKPLGSRLGRGNAGTPEGRREPSASAERPSHEARPRLVIDFMDVDSDKWAQYGRETPGPLKWVYRLESRLLARYEARVAGAFDATLLVSAAEADLFRKRVGSGRKIHAVGNGVALEYFHPAPEGAGPRDADPPTVVFCGAMDYFPNVDAVTWFADEVLPLVRAKLGDVRFTIVGSKPTERVRALGAREGITVTGRVEDVRPYVWGAHASVAPIRIARGVQNKVLEAMAMGKAVVATPEAFEGIEARPGVDLVVSPAEPPEFAADVAAVLTDGSLNKQLEANGHSAVTAAYPWPTQLAPLANIVTGVEGSVRTSSHAEQAEHERLR